MHIDEQSAVVLTKKGEEPRQGLHFDDDGIGSGGNWKAVFMEQRRAVEIWAEPSTDQDLNLRTDPFESRHHLKHVLDWYSTRPPDLAGSWVQPFLNSFKDYPPRQKAASFTLDQALAKMSESFNSGH